MINNNARIAVLGIGLEGRDVITYLQKHGYGDITVFDKKERKELDLAGIKVKEIKFVTGTDYLKSGLTDFQIIFRSPGIYRYLPEIVKAESRGAEITSSIKLFLEEFKGLTIGVTGTKGKGTTSTLIYEIIKQKTNNIYIAGNIGSPPLSILDNSTKDSIAVLELSSFQLIDLTKSPKISVVLNVTSDHMDWHKNQREYVKAKKNIVRFQGKSDIKVLNFDYRTSKFFENLSPSQNYFFSKYANFSSNGTVIARTVRTKQSQNRLPRCVPQSRTSLAMTNDNQGILGVYVKDGIICSNFDGKNVEIGNTDKLLLRGRHNWENVCAAICASQLAGAKIESIKKAVFSFKGLEHRLELVKEVGGVKYYNDSFSTNPDTSIAAVDSFTEPITLILGGYDKGLNFEKMVKHFCKKPNLQNVVLIGDTELKLFKLLKKYIYDNSIERMGKPKMLQIVKKCKELTKPGGVVLLSPACASFDMFESYKDRGEQFKKEVNKLQRY